MKWIDGSTEIYPGRVRWKLGSIRDKMAHEMMSYRCIWEVFIGPRDLFARILRQEGPPGEKEKRGGLGWK